MTSKVIRMDLEDYIKIIVPEKKRLTNKTGLKISDAFVLKKMLRK